jgi:MSHA biogenesis protein MshL
LPPVLNDDNLAGLSNTFQYLGVRDSFLERNGRSIVFRCNRKVLRNVEDYLTKIRQSRSMIIYDLQILQVDLKDGSRMGIKWNSYRKSADQSSITDPAEKTFSNLTSTAGTGFDVFLVGRSFQNNLLIEFLNTQGNVKSLSKPRMGVMSGTKGSLRVGQTPQLWRKWGATCPPQFPRPP